MTEDDNQLSFRSTLVWLIDFCKIGLETQKASLELAVILMPLYWLAFEPLNPIERPPAERVAISGIAGIGLPVGRTADTPHSNNSLTFLANVLLAQKALISRLVMQFSSAYKNL